MAAAFFAGILECLVAFGFGATRLTLICVAVLAFMFGLVLVLLSTRDTARARFFGVVYLGLACAVAVPAHVLAWTLLPMEIADALGGGGTGLFPIVTKTGVMVLSLYLTLAVLVLPWWRYVSRWRELRRNNVHARVSVRDCE